MAKLPSHLHQQIVQRICRAPLELPDARLSWLSGLTGRPSYNRVDWTGAIEDFANGLTHRLPVPDLIDALHALNRYFGDGAARTEITNLCTQLADHQPSTNNSPNALYDHYRQNRVAEWAKPEYTIDKHFVRLILLKEQTEGIRFVEPVEARSYNDLRDVLRDTSDAAFVLLGGPGSGKSTLLRRLQMDEAEDRLIDHGSTLTFYVPLNRYPPDAHDPRTWLADEWQVADRDMPPLTELLNSGQMILLLDALNEMSHRDEADYADRVRQWDDFLYRATQQGNRAVLTCRTLDYTAQLGRNHAVTRVTVKPMTPALIEAFLRQHLGNRADAVYAQLSGDAKQLALYSTPYFLSLLVKHIQQAPAGAALPRGRAALFTAFVRESLRRELHKHAITLTLITARDRAKLNNNQWASDTDLPDQGELFRHLSSLAYALQDRSSSDGTQVRLKLTAALKLLPAETGENILAIGRGLNILDEDLARGEVQFFHQLWQEYFAARQLVGNAADAAERVRQPWRADDVAESLTQTLARLSDRDPLPGLPSTGWEETVLMAAAMTDSIADGEAFVQAVTGSNLSLAGLCAAAPDVQISESLRQTIRQELVARSRDPQADLRARIAAGETLGRLGDPRFVRVLAPTDANGKQSTYLRPPLIKVVGGLYTIGDSQPATPAHSVKIKPFWMGKFPVTNAEFKCFIDAGGYEQETWWETKNAKKWRSGNLAIELRSQMEEYFQKSEEEIKKELSKIPLERISQYMGSVVLSYRDFFSYLVEVVISNLAQPDLWEDPRFDNPCQPVVGVSWYEAQAYSTWLSAQTGEIFRLPTEVEWEAACRGMEGRQYAYGDDFDVQHVNTSESLIFRTTPIGVFPGGDTSDGLVDLVGNVWEWTSSLFADYPYSNTAKHENVTSAAARVLRGSSWRLNQVFARASCRSSVDPDIRNDSVGFRLVCVRPLVI